ncbi:unnamed protein product [Cunninghamella blakesleeana]
MSPTHSPNSSMILPAPALSADSSSLDPSSAQMADLLQQTSALGNDNGNNNQSSSSPQSSEMADELPSQPSSPIYMTSPNLSATPPHLPTGSSVASSQHQAHPSSSSQPIKYRILTIHLEKDQDGLEWAIPVSAGWKSEMDLDITSAYHLAYWHETRMGNLKRALDYYLNAAERGHTKSMVKAAALYEADKDLVPNATTYPEKDMKKSFYWYKYASDLPFVSETANSSSKGPDPLACYVVGSLYGAGSTECGVEKDYEQAIYYYNRCMLITAPHIDIDFRLVDQEHIPKSLLRNNPPQTRDERYFSSSAFQTGLVYLYGSEAEGETIKSITKVDVDASLALRYWKEAAVLGHAQASYNIGIVYANGMGVDQQLFEAGKWFGRALKLDATQRLVAPAGVKVINDWDAKEHSSEENDQMNTKKESKDKSTTRDTKEKKQRRKKKKSKKQTNTNNDVLGLVLVVGSATAIIGGVVWWLQHRSKKQ